MHIALINKIIFDLPLPIQSSLLEPTGHEEDKATHSLCPQRYSRAEWTLEMTHLEKKRHPEVPSNTNHPITLQTQIWRAKLAPGARQVVTEDVIFPVYSYKAIL